MAGRSARSLAQAAMMKAVRVEKFGGPDVLQLQRVPVPQVEPGQVLVDIRAVGINPVETYIRAGTYPRLPPLPFTPGNDAAGLVVDVAEGITAFKKGDRVFTTRASVTGAYAESGVFPVGSVWPLPATLSFQQGAAVGAPYFTAYRALVAKCHVKPSESVFVHGASGAVRFYSIDPVFLQADKRDGLQVGIATVQLAKSLGMKVYGSAGTTEGMELVKSAGAEEVFNHKQQGYTDTLMERTGGVDHIVEMLSNVNLGKDLELLKQNGRVAVVGCRGPVEINPRLMMGKETSIVGVQLGASNEEEWKEIGDAVVKGLESGALRPIIAREYRIEDAPQAHQDIINSSGAQGKLVFRIAQSE